MKGKALRKHSLHGKIAASVLLKLFISGNKRCHTIDTLYTLKSVEIFVRSSFYKDTISHKTNKV